MQSRLESAIESGLNIGSGFFISLLVWIYIVGPLYNIETKMLENLGITSIFTVVSVIRSYVWRRLFNYRVRQKLLNQ